MLKKGDIETHVNSFLEVELRLEFGENISEWNIPSSKLELIKALCFDPPSLDGHPRRAKKDRRADCEAKKDLETVITMFQDPKTSFQHLHLDLDEDPNALDEVKYALALKLSELIKQYTKEKEFLDVEWEKRIDLSLVERYKKIPTSFKIDSYEAIARATLLCLGVNMMYMSFLIKIDHLQRDFNGRGVLDNFGYGYCLLQLVMNVAWVITEPVMGVKLLPRFFSQLLLPSSLKLSLERVIQAKKPPELSEVIPGTGRSQTAPEISRREELEGRAQMIDCCLSFFCGVICDPFLLPRNEIEDKELFHMIILVLLVIARPITRPYSNLFVAGAISAGNLPQMFRYISDLIGDPSLLAGVGSVSKYL